MKGCVGAVGGILAVAKVAPQACVNILNLFKKGKVDEARTLQSRLTPFAKGVTTKYGIGGLKMVMDLTGYFGDNPRPPPETARKRSGRRIEEVDSPP